MENISSTILDEVEKLSVNDKINVETEHRIENNLEVCQIEISHPFPEHDGKAICLTKGGDWPNLILVMDIDKKRVFSYSPVAVNGDNKIFEDEGVLKSIDIDRKNYSNSNYKASNFL